ncbi:MAG: hypothetical protein JXA00_01445 [Candidatus Thermoplasmatota archaeon]|nr:hypothetical protein [Candidatus Thermoplasmatota archaeon]
MKKILPGVVICLIVFISSISAVATATNLSPPAPLDDDVPIWQVGNSWTYTVDPFVVDYDYSGQTVLMDGSIEDFTWRVTDTSDATYYKVEYTGKLTATYDIYLSSFSGKLDMAGTFKPTWTRLKGTILFTKADLQIHHATAEIKGITMATIAPLPFALPIPFKVIADVDFSTDFPLFNFPLNDNKYWTMPSLDITIQANAGGILGIFQVPIQFVTSYSWTPFAFHCQEQRDITVPAGTFSAYKISSLFGDVFDYYYAPTVGNIIKIDATLQNGAASAELTSFNYP